MRALPAAAAAAMLAACLLSCRTVEVSAPPPRPVQQPAAIGHLPAPRPAVSWQVIPPDGYLDEQRFVLVEYAPCTTRPPGADDDPVPPGGWLTVHLGYRDLRDANTAWYTFEVVEAGRTLLRQDGSFDVPNIKGPDGYWWNDVVLDLPAEVAMEARVTVTERRSGRAHGFVLRRLEAPGQVLPPDP